MILSRLQKEKKTKNYTESCNMKCVTTFDYRVRQKKKRSSTHESNNNEMKQQRLLKYSLLNFTSVYAKKPMS